MNRGQLVTRIRQHLAEAGQGQYSDATLQDQVSVSARSLAGELGLIQSRSSVVSTGANGTVALPPGTVNVIGASITGRGGVLQCISGSQALANDQRALDGTLSGSPAYLIVDEGLLGPNTARLYPGNTDGYGVTIQAFVDGGDLVSDSDIPWGGRYDAYHDVIAYHAAHHLVTRQGKAASADPTWLNRYHDRLESLRDRGSLSQVNDQTRFSVPIRRQARGGWSR